MADDPRLTPADGDLRARLAEMYPCICDPAYTERGLTAPDCVWHRIVPEFLEIRDTELERLRAELANVQRGADTWKDAADGWEERAERLTAERDEQRQRAEQAEAAIARVRARHVPHDCHRDHIKASTPIPCVNADLCRCGSPLPCSELAALDASTTPESLCPRCEGSRVEPGTEAEGDWDPAAMRHHPHTGEPCTACNGTSKATGWLDQLAAASLRAAKAKFGPDGSELCRCGNPDDCSCAPESPTDAPTAPTRPDDTHQPHNGQETTP